MWPLMPRLSPELAGERRRLLARDAHGRGACSLTRAQLKAGETVLVWGIGGGVSLAAMRIAKLRGAKVIVTSSSDDKLQQARRLGADVTLNYRTQKVAQEVRALTEKRGVDVRGGECRRSHMGRLGALSRARRAARHLRGDDGAESDARLAAAVLASLVAARLDDGQRRRVRGDRAVVRAGATAAIVDRVYPLAEAGAAYERLAKGEQLGESGGGDRYVRAFDCYPWAEAPARQRRAP